MRRRYKAFFLADAIVGLAVLGILAGILISVSRDYARVGARLGQHAEALNRAQSILQQLHAGQPVPASPDVTIRQLASATEPPSGFQWVQVSIQTTAAPVSLTGLVPAEPKGARR